MRLRGNQEEVFELHAFRCRAFRQLDSRALAEEEGNCVPELHARKVDANT
jgi:hypothetical protein